MEVRRLVTKDLFTLAKIIGKAGRIARIDIGKKLFGEKSKDPSEIGFDIIMILISEGADAIKAWLADLIGKKVEEFDQMPLDTSIDIVSKLVEQENLGDFFGKVSRLVTLDIGKK